ncbi:murein biosynthesis integral membrane protein MurJ [Microbacterium sp. Bi121]|uniref:murein biosynthesis integral membrane protein MurJ n=1 Tax=Microbacterium sp. Bi121 TaxID=2822348 RepID=UPI001D1EB42F|nr:murein biosynthesis integral membrane protein MurJ [Microbacterium sp. Bi121]CAH0173434.1 putative peptidoglycan biosynthesis protein MviN [Microbacterium sp. Bi121]
MGIGRASAMIAAGTLVSRLTGLLRAVVLVAAIGSVGMASDAFAVANQLPNSIYQVISAGVLTGVIVPQVVRATAHNDGGHAFLAKLLTLGTIIVGSITLVATLGAPVLIDLYSDFGPAQSALAIQFAYWCVPQLFFYGMFALLGEILNARRVFGPYAWAPIVNNAVSIAGFVLFMVLFGQSRSGLGGWNTEMIALLGGTATLGVIAQMVVLVLFWRRIGIPLRLDFQWRGMGLGRMGKLAFWTFLTTLAGQLVGLVQSRVVTPASGENASVAASQYTWLVFMVAYSTIVLAIGTPYFTRISEEVAAEKGDEVRETVRQAIRILGLLVVVAMAAIAVASIPASRIFSKSAAEAVLIAPLLLAYLVSLLPLAVLFVVQRTFYAYGDARTPFIYTLIQAALLVVLTLVVAATTPLEQRAAMVALAQSVASTVQTVIAAIMLKRKFGSFGLGGTMLALGRFVLLAVPAAAAGWGVFLLVGGVDSWMLSGMLQGALGAALIAVVTGVVFVALLALFRVPELTTAVRMLRRR